MFFLEDMVNWTSSDRFMETNEMKYCFMLLILTSYLSEFR